jgi:hypothetical protein
MTKSTADEKREAATARQKERKRAYSMREKLRAGRELSSEDTEWLAQYEASAKKTGPSVRKEPDAPNNGNGDAPVVDQSETVVDPKVDSAPLPDDTVVQAPVRPEQAAPPPVPQLPPPPVADSLPTPPRVSIGEDDSAPRGKGAWQDKYRGKADGGEGREKTCVFIAEQWLGILLAMESQIKESGGKPLIDVQSLGGAIVLTVDELLPTNVKLTPRMIALGGTTAITVQRFMRRKEIGAVEELKSDRAKFDAARAKANAEREAREQAEASARATSAAPAAPTPTVELPVRGPTLVVESIELPRAATSDDDEELIV